MAKKITKTDPNLVGLIKNLKEKSNTEEVAIWKDVAKRIQRATRRRAEVNLSQINRISNADETVLIPGKVLSDGVLDHKVDVVALNFSKTAQEKIEKSGGECISISNILEKNLKGTNIRILE
jgi:large subunit ribosomal protein L18e